MSQSFFSAMIYVPNLDFLEEDRNEKELSQLVHIGTSGLHALSNSMKHGEKASGSNVKKLHRIFALNI